MAPLNSDQRYKFAVGHGVKNVDDFINEIERANAEIFAERPQDLLELITYWNEHGKFGPHAVMIDYNVEKKLTERNPDRKDSLTAMKARQGVERLAAGLTLTRKSAFVLRDQSTDTSYAVNALAAGEILSDWNPEEVQSLLGRALFDEATYGRVRFHHQSVREFLTARWLFNLLRDFKQRRAIEGLIFADRYQLELVIPSMVPVAAWLALWDDRICCRLVEISPEILIGYGDPSSLPLETRVGLLKRFARLSDEQKSRDVSFDIAAVRRLADPQLADTINELLDQYRFNEDVRQLMLRLVWQGRITACREKVLGLAVNLNVDS